MFRFIHAADIHLDSPLLGLERYDGAPVESIRGATRRALESLVQLALSEDVDFVLIAGDLYDGDWRDFNTGLYFHSQMSHLLDAGIQVFVASGNHDAESQITRSLRLPENVHTLRTDAPETVELEDAPVVIHGQGYAKRAVTSNLAAGYPAALPDRFNIGLLHTSVAGYEGHEPYAPCGLDDLLEKGYDYWALGHVHRRDVLKEDSPCILFSGNTQGRNIRETGAKGCTMVTVDDAGDVSFEHHPLDVLRWVSLHVDVTEAEDGYEAVERVSEQLEEELAESQGRLLAVRIQLSGACSAHEELAADPEKWTSEIRAATTELSSRRAWVEKVTAATMPMVDERELREGEGPVADLLRYFESVRDDAAALEGLAEELKDLRSRLPISLRRGEGALDLKGTGTLRALLDGARQMLLVRLMREEAQ